MFTVLAAVAGQAAPVPPAARGSIAVVESPEPTGIVADAVERALSDVGFTLIPSAAHARYVATPVLRRTVRGAARTSVAPPRASAGGGMTFGNGAGLGVRVPFGSAVVVGQSIATELTLRIARRDGTGPVWEGRAITYRVGGTRSDDPAMLAKRLSDAILRNLSGPSGVLTSIP